MTRSKVDGAVGGGSLLPSDPVEEKGLPASLEGHGGGGLALG